MRIRAYSLALLFSLITVWSGAQNVSSISKQEILDKVLENNSSVKLSEQSLLSAKADYLQTTSIFLPQVMVSHTGMVTTNPLMAFGSKLNQAEISQADFNPDLLNKPDETTNFATLLQVQQPLLNMDGVFQRKAAKTTLQATNLQAQRTKEYLSFEVDEAYMKLQLAHLSVSVLKKAQQTAESNMLLAKNKYEQGLLQYADLLAFELRVSEVKNLRETAASQVQNASNYLSYLMNEKQESIYLPTDSLQLQTSFQTDTSSILSNRSDIKALSLASKAYEALYKAEKMTYLPRLNAFGSFELYDDEAFGMNANGYLVGVRLSLDIFNGATRIGKIKKSKALYHKSLLEYENYVAKNQLEISKVYRLLAETQEKLKLSKLALERSEELLRIRNNRFEEGLEKASDVLIAESQYAQKELEYHQTIYQYNFTLSYLNFLTKE